MESPGGAKGTSAARAPRAPRAAPAAAPLEEKTTNRRPAPGRQGAKAGSARARPGAAASASTSAAASAAPVAPTSSAADQKEIADLKHESAELKVTMEGLERERDFYFGKLRDIEIMLQQDEPAEEDDQTPVARSIYKILYATEEDMPAEEGVVEEAEADVMADAAVPLAAC
jgi:RP/EB family microtubule-associated protein